LNLCLRRGLNIWHLRDDGMKDLRCMSFMSKDRSVVVVAGCQNVMLKVDLEKGKVIERASMSPIVLDRTLIGARYKVSTNIP